MRKNKNRILIFLFASWILFLPKSAVAAPFDHFAVSLEGEWQIKGMPPEIKYVFLEENGELFFLTMLEGNVSNRRSFIVIDPNTIRISEATRGSYAGDAYTTMEMLEIILLDDPPQILTFSGTEEVLVMEGLFESAPLTLIKSSD